ncbi:hypothetical protein RCL1_008785 [Eukaryota sp. TZLM3-RCL]
MQTSHLNSQSVFVPHSCLFRILSYAISNSIDKHLCELKHIKPLILVFSHISRFGNVSSFFRNVASEVVCNYLTFVDPIISLFTHYDQLKFLSLLSPSLSFFVKVCSFPLPNDSPSFNVHSLLLENGLITGDDGVVHHLSDTDCPFKSLSTLNLVSVKSLRLSQFPLDFLLSSILSTFSQLKSLHLSEVEFDNDLVSFPSHFSNLLKLSIDDSKGDRELVIRVCKLVHLESLSIRSGYGIQSTVTGLSSLQFLKELDLIAVNITEQLNPNAVLQSISLTALLSECLELIFTNPLNFSQSKITLTDCIVPEAFHWVLRSKGLCFHCDSDQLSNGKLLGLGSAEELSVTIFEKRNVTFSANSLLHLRKLSVIVDSFSRGTIVFPLMPHLQELMLSDVVSDSLFEFISKCRYLSRLELSWNRFYTIETKNLSFSFSLPFLKYLALGDTDWTAFKSIQCSRLTSLKLSSVTNVDVDCINYKFPRLATLRVDDCTTIGSNLVDNDYLQSLVISRPPFDSVFVLSLHVFRRLKMLSLSITIPFPSQFILPQTLQNIHLRVHSSLVGLLYSPLPRLKVFSCDVVVDDDFSAVQVGEQLSEFTQSRGDVACKIKTINKSGVPYLVDRFR